jgi:glycosyltransferase involved in cell wall biosynthesis
VSNVWFFRAADDGASWYRADQPALTLRWTGHATWTTELVVPSIAAKADVVVASRPARPEALRVLENIRTRYGARIVADLDDDYWSMGPENTLAYQSWHLDDDGALLRGLEDGLRQADVITVASQGIREAVVEHAGVPDSKVHVVPNGLHASILGLPRDYERGLSNDDVVTIGWSGTASSIQGLDLCARALGRIVTKYGDKVRLRLVGFQPQAASETVRRHLEVSGDIAHAEWVPHGDQYLAAVAAFDIWVAPYHNTAFNHAKFPTKALEAGFWGIPLVASDIRHYAEWIEHGQSGYLVSEYTPHLWSRHLCELIESPELRRKIGEASRSRAVSYSLQEVGRQWEAALFG